MNPILNMIIKDKENTPNVLLRSCGDYGMAFTIIEFGQSVYIIFEKVPKVFEFFSEATIETFITLFKFS